MARNAKSQTPPNAYQRPAGGWGALKSTARAWMDSDNRLKNIRSLLKTNQPNGFDCPGCAWGDKQHPERFRFCENGAKAVNWEATGRRVDADFFKQNSVAWLRKQSDFFLEYQGRLTEPMRYNRSTDHYEAVSWEEAFALIGQHLRDLESPDQAEFYTSGRASNEAAFMYQLFVRAFGTNNFPDCSNLCHEASGRALTASIGVGKGTVTMDDFAEADAIFVFGQNPGTNHPRMLATLREAHKRGCRILSFNSLKERGLERFQDPQNAIEMLTDGSERISDDYYRPNLGGDMAVLRGVSKALLAMEDNARAKGHTLFDQDFITAHTTGLEEWIAQVKATSWSKIEEQSGLSQQNLNVIADVYVQSGRVIFTWAMGITQHRHSVATIQEMVNLLSLRGNIGKPGAGLCPVRGHSNVQGDRTMGIDERPSTAFLDRLGEHFGFEPPRAPGHNAVEAIRAMRDGRSRVFIGLGGNFAAATPDTEVTESALERCRLTVQISTKLNRSHLVVGEDALILPCLGRTDIDRQAGGEQRVTVEDSFSMVHASGGVLEPLSDAMKSEPDIIAGIAEATLGDFPINWQQTVADYDVVRQHIAAVIKGFDNFNDRIQNPGGFYLGNAARERKWNTASNKVQIFAHGLPDHILPIQAQSHINENSLILQTLRSHDQYNTTVYSNDDRYRGIKNQRRVLLINPEDIARLGFQPNDTVTLQSCWDDGRVRQVQGFALIPYDIPRGNVAAYYPETNPLVPLDSVGEGSNTPTSKSIGINILQDRREQIQAIDVGAGQ